MVGDSGSMGVSAVTFGFRGDTSKISEADQARKEYGKGNGRLNDLDERTWATS